MAPNIWGKNKLYVSRVVLYVCMYMYSFLSYICMRLFCTTAHVCMYVDILVTVLFAGLNSGKKQCIQQVEVNFSRNIALEFFL